MQQQAAGAAALETALAGHLEAIMDLLEVIVATATAIAAT